MHRTKQAWKSVTKKVTGCMLVSAVCLVKFSDSISKNKKSRAIYVGEIVLIEVVEVCDSYSAICGSLNKMGILMQNNIEW